MIGATDMTGVIICAWVIGIVGVVWGLWVATTGRAQLLRGQPLVQGPLIRLLGLLCAVVAATVAWYILTNPIVQQQ